MTKPPLILISPNIERKGTNLATSRSACRRPTAGADGAGAMPLVLPATLSRELIAECVRRSDGVLLTGGEDVDPRLYAEQLAAAPAPHGDGDARRRRRGICANCC